MSSPAERALIASELREEAYALLKDTRLFELLARSFTEPMVTGSASYDLNVKLRVYRRNGVREYVVWRVLDNTIDWFILRNGQFEPLAADAEGILRSEVFPGLCLNPSALIAGDLAAVCRAQQAAADAPEHAAFVERLRQARSAP